MGVVDPRSAATNLNYLSPNSQSCLDHSSQGLGSNFRVCHALLEDLTFKLVKWPKVPYSCSETLLYNHIYKLLLSKFLGQSLTLIYIPNTVRPRGTRSMCPKKNRVSRNRLS